MCTGRLLLWIAVVFLGALGWGCSSSAQVEPRYASEDPVAQDEFDRARALFQQGELEQAEQLFSNFVIEHPEDALRPGAELHLGRIAVQEGEHDAATVWFERAAVSTDEALATTARRELGASLLREGEAERALAVLEPLAGRLDGQEAATLYGTMAEAAGQLEDRPRQLRFLDARCRYGGRAECQSSAEQIREIVEGFDEAMLTSLHESLPRNGHAWVVVTGRLGAMAAARGDREGALTMLESLEGAEADQGPDGEALRTALEELQQIDWDAVGLLLPLSGRARLVGEQMRAGVELAVEQRAEEETPLRLVVRDSAGDEASIRRAVELMAETERVSAIIGPVDSNLAAAAAERAQELGVPLLALSIRPDLTDQRRWVLRSFQSNEAEIHALMNHASQRLGHRSFAVLHPDSNYGRVLLGIVEREAQALGVSITVTRSYPPSQTSFVEDCQALVEHSFDALIIPDRSRTVSLIAPALATVGLWSTPPDRALPNDEGRAIQLLLPSIAFSPSLVRQAGRYLQGAVFTTPLWVEDPEARVARFVEDFREATGRPPTVYASQAHDALQILRAARSRAAGQTRAALLEALLSIREAPTVGSFDGFDESGEPRSPLRLLTLEGENFLRSE